MPEAPPAPLSAIFTGLGSIGTRRLLDLHAACAARGIPLEVTALRSSRRALPAAAAPLVDRELFEPPRGQRYRLAFITGPTSLHAAHLAALAGQAEVFFIEKPIFSDPQQTLEAVGLGSEQKAYVAASLRHTALYTALKGALEGRRPCSARALCSSYLPGWRPDADYRHIYSASAALGGGVTLDLIHEWDYLTDLFGLPEACYNLRGRFSHLEIDSDDLSVYIACYPQLLCEVHLDYFGRSYRRTAEFLCEDGTLLADFGNGRLRLPDGTEEAYAEPPGSHHKREMAWFLDYAAGAAGENLNDPRRALELLRLVLNGKGTHA
jgi:predicted dehydrogenase